MAVGPGVEAFVLFVGPLGGVFDAEVVEGAVHVAVLDGGLVFEFLHEVVTPAEAGVEAFEAVEPLCAFGGWRIGAQLGGALVGGGEDLRGGDGAPGEVYGEPGAGVGGGDGAGHVGAVVAAALVEEGVEVVVSASFAGWLALRAVARGDAECVVAWLSAVIECG